MEHCHPSATTPPAESRPAGIDAAAPVAPVAPPVARKPHRSTADYRWTQPKVIAFLEALARCGRVAEAARAVGMSKTSAYRLRARMSSARFDAAFEGARQSGIRARAEASRARAAAARSPWEGPGIAAMAARERALELVPESGAQGDISRAQGAGSGAQGAARTAQGVTTPPQGAALPRKVTKFSPGPCNTRSKYQAVSRPGEGA